MLSNEERKICRRPQIIEVICQLRFPEILVIQAQDPFEFQEKIRADYPQYQKTGEQGPAQVIDGKKYVPAPIHNYQFISEDGLWKLSLTKGFLALSSRGYTRWEDFAKRLDKVLASFIQVYRPAYFTRIGLRYVNGFNREKLGLADCGWRELIRPAYLGLLQSEELGEKQFSKCEQEVVASLPGGAKTNIKSGMGLLRKVNNRTGEAVEEPVFMLDLDLFMDGKVQVNHTAPALNILHANADSLFRGAVTDTLLDAMEPLDPN